MPELKEVWEKFLNGWPRPTIEQILEVAEKREELRQEIANYLCSLDPSADRETLVEVIYRRTPVPIVSEAVAMRLLPALLEESKCERHRLSSYPYPPSQLMDWPNVLANPSRRVRRLTRIFSLLQDEENRKKTFEEMARWFELLPEFVGEAYASLEQTEQQSFWEEVARWQCGPSAKLFRDLLKGETQGITVSGLCWDELIRKEPQEAICLHASLRRSKSAPNYFSDSEKLVLDKFLGSEQGELLSYLVEMEFPGKEWQAYRPKAAKKAVELFLAGKLDRLPSCDNLFHFIEAGDCVAVAKQAHELKLDQYSEAIYNWANNWDLAVDELSHPDREKASLVFAWIKKNSSSKMFFEQLVS